MKKGNGRAILATVLVALIMLAAGAVATAATEPEIAIKYGNLGYNDGRVTLGYAVEYKNLPSTAEHGLLIWKAEPEKYYLKGREDVLLLSNEKVTIDGGEYYEFTLSDIAEREITEDIYAVAYARVGTKVYYSELNKHSPLRYARLADGSIGDARIDDGEVLAFLAEMIENGAAAQRAENYRTDRLADADFVELTVENGSFADGTSKGLFIAGSTIDVTAFEPLGEIVSDWLNSQGASIALGSASIKVPDKSGVIKPAFIKAGTGIEYDLCADDARFTETPPSSYEFGRELILPEPERAGYEFSGWYTSPELDVSTAINKISETHKGDVKLYAAWSKQLYRDDFSILTGVSIGVDDKKQYTTSGRTTFRTANGDGSTIASGEGGIIWHSGTVGSDFLVSPSGGLAGLMGKDNVVTIRASISLAEGKTPAASYARLRVAYKNETIPIFNVASDGAVYLGSDKSYKIATLTNDLQYVTVSVDFSLGEITAISEDGYLLARRTISIPSGSKFTNFVEWKEGTTSYLLNWYSGGISTDNAVRIGEVSAYSGSYGLRSSEKVLSTDELIARLEALIAANSAFTKSDFSSKYSSVSTYDDTTMPTPVYNSAPALFARDDGDGARLMLNDSMIAGIIATLEDEAYAKSYSSLLALADSNVDGVLGEPTLNYNGRKGLHNFNSGVLATIEAKAFMFRILYEQDLEEGSYDAYRRDVYGYEAIVAIKNFLETLHIEYISSDQCREYGYTMFVAAEVYDWCYPLLTKKDKDEIKYAVITRCCSGTSGSTDNNLTTSSGAKMEVGYPPSKQGSVSGHGSEAQVLRDYLSFALAIYDEDPTWWEYVAGRVVGDYVAVRNVYHESGITQQGVSNYAHHRHYSDLYSAWIIKTATSENPYTAMDRTMISVISSSNPSGEYFFSSGDGAIERATSAAANNALIASAIYNNDTLFTWAYDYKSGFNISSASGTSSVTLANMFIFISQGMERVEDKYAELDPILYNGYPLGQMVTRYRWNDPDAAGTYMKIGIRTTANHEHKDAGTFQIYYKGLLTSDSGLYDNYGHEHTQQYQQSTIAHNGLLVFNPSKWSYTSTNAATKWYSGGQRKPGEASTLDKWLSSTYDTADLMGAQYGYKDEAERLADYAYIAGDITKAYEQDTVKYMTRSMLTVYNDPDSDFPMYFFVFDSIESADASFKKTFLLHIRGLNAPTVDGNVITTENGEGRLVVHSLSEGTTITPVGGIAYGANGKYDAAASSNYLINGYQLVPLGKGNDGNWGRVEVSTVGKTKSTFMHAMYVTDRGSTATAPTVEKILSDGIEGAIIGNVAAVFRDSNERTLSKVSFATSGEGELRYYVAGLFEGTWKITANGKDLGTVKAGEGGMAVFTAPRGEITLAPGEDIMPEGGGHIFYETLGGKLPEDAPTSFKRGGGVVLPIPTNGESEFIGWYTTADYSGKPIDRVPSDASGEFTVYAKWRHVFLSEDFDDLSKSDIAMSGAGDSRRFGRLRLSILEGSKATVKLETDTATKNKYISVTPAGGEISITGDGYLDIENVHSTKVTYSMELANGSTGRSARAIFALKGSSDVVIFNIGSDGSLNIGTKKVATLTNKLTRYDFTVDFSAQTVTVTDESGNVLGTSSVSGLTMGMLGTSLFEFTITHGTSGTAKYNIEIGKIDVRPVD